MKTAKIFVMLLLFEIACFGQGTTVIWNESINGSLSNDGNSPTQLGSLQAGTDIVSGSTEFQPSGGGGGIGWGDYFTFIVPNSYEASSLSFTVDKPVWVWVGDETLTYRTGVAFNPSSGDLFSQMNISSLAAGTYGMYVENHDADAPSFSIANYQLNFSLTVVPEPSTIALGAVGIAALLFFRRRAKG